MASEILEKLSNIFSSVKAEEEDEPEEEEKEEAEPEEEEKEEAEPEEEEEEEDVSSVVVRVKCLNLMKLLGGRLN